MVDFFLYDHLYEKSFLSSKENLISELQRLLNNPDIPPYGSQGKFFDKKLYEKLWRENINSLIKTYSN